MAHSLTTRVSSSIWEALTERSRSSGQSVSHIVQAALAEALDVDHHSIFQVSTSGAIVQGLYQGCVSVADLRRHGDVGLGTFEDLDGEMILIDGRCYQARSDGSVVEAADTELTPFASVVNFAPDRVWDVTDISSYQDLTEHLDGVRTSDNGIVSFLATGTFRSIVVRAACRTESGVDLVAATSNQSVFGFEDVSGTLVGFWSPEYTKSIAIAGYHVHFISEGRDHGGHLIDLSAATLRVEINDVSDVHLAIPETQAFLAADLAGDHSRALDIAEHQARGALSEGPPVLTRRAVVIMSGGDAVSPFTTPDQACSSGLAAGNTDTAVREHLLAQGYRVFTAPAMNGRTEVVAPEPDSFGAFGGMPVVLPAHMTVNSVGDIDAAGEHLARFVAYLHAEHDVDEVDWIGHSNGGLFARAATRVLHETGSPVAVRSLTTLGTPWLGSVPLRFAAGEIPLAEAGGDPMLEKLFAGLTEHAALTDLGLAPENTEHYMAGPGGWNAAQAGVLDGIPALLVAGTHFDAYAGDPTVWPFDGLVARFSALAQAVTADVLRDARRVEFPVTHSIWVSDLAGLPWETGMTWSPDVLAAVSAFLAEVTHP